MTHICVSRLTIIGTDNGLSPGRRQAIIWTNAGILLIGPLGTNFNETSIAIHTFSFKKIHLKLSSGKWRPFFLGLDVSRDCSCLGGSYGISCPAQGRHGSPARGTSPDNKWRGFYCHISQPIVINPDYNVTIELCIKRMYCKICSNSPSNPEVTPTCLHCEVTCFPLLIRVVALQMMVLTQSIYRHLPVDIVG